MGAETFPVFRLTEEARDQLLLEAEANPEIYLNPNTDFGKVLAERDITEYVEETGIFSTSPIKLTPTSSGPRPQADRQATAFYHSLVGMSPSSATDGLIWTWMTHFKLHAYSIQRWPQQRSLINHIKNHWFVMNQAGALRQDNTAGRTWWIANTAIKAAETSAGIFKQEEAIQHFANHPRHYHNMMDSNFSRHPLICAELLRALMNEAKGMKVVSSDHIWKRMNLNAGTLLLDAMPREEIRRIINEHVEAIMSKPEFVADRSKLRKRRPTRVLSLGAGVQSSCLALMSDQGAYGLPKPDFAIFADTGWERQEVYDHLKWLEAELSYKIIVVKNGNLRDNILEGIMPDGSKFLGIPAYLTNPDGTSSILHRQCTTHYKTKPIHDYLRKSLKIEPRRRAPIDIQVEMWLGISTDEAIRQKPEREEWVNKRYPLIELGFNRFQLLTWFKEHYPDRDLPSSSCIGCPYHNDSVWKQIKEKDPKSFQEAVFIDQALRNVPATKGTVKGDAYLHKSRIPLVEVDFSKATAYDDLMLEECEGLCGI